MRPRAGQKLFTLQTVPPRPQGLEGEPNGAARAGGFSLHAGVDIAPNQRAKLERLCRYVSRPPAASERLALTASGQVRYALKTPYQDGNAQMPFFNWLPDELAFAYSRFNDRKSFKDRYRQVSPEDMHEFLRHGRGASYHELECALGAYRVVSSLSTFRGYRHTLRRSLRERRYKKLLKSVKPDLHDGWFEPWLDIVVAKG